MTNVKAAMEYAAKIEREAMEGRLKTTVDKNEGALYENRVRENAIVFTKEGGEWVMRITQDCISVNDNVSVDDAAEAVVAAIGRYLNKSKWVGLTDEDMKDTRTHNFNFIDGARWAEEKLRSRNGG
jgi:hypothetical protein